MADLGTEIWNTVSGKDAMDAKNAQQTAQNTMKQQAATQFNEGNTNYENANKYLQQVYGQNPNQEYNQQLQNAQGQAQAQAGVTGNLAQQQATQQARAAGLNPGQAALAGGSQVSNAYGNQYNSSVNSGLDQMQQNANRNTQAAEVSGGQGAQMAGQGANEASGVNSSATQQQQNANAAQSGLFGGIATRL